MGKVSKALILATIISVVLVPLITMLPRIEINVSSVVNSEFYAIIRAACYFIPIHTVADILLLTVNIWVFRMVVTMIRVIWQLLPFFN